MKQKTLAEQKLMLADLIEKGRSMLSKEELTDLVPHLTLQLQADWHSKRKLFAYPLGFALVAKLGSLLSAKKYLLRLWSEKKLMPYKTLGISKCLAQALYKEFTPYYRYKKDAVAWLRAESRKKGDRSICIIEPNQFGLYSKKALAVLKKLGI